jgi:hypothetical protein
MESDPKFAAQLRKRERAATRRWLESPENQAKARKACLDYYYRRKASDPESINETARMGYALRQERKGRPVKSRRTVIDGTQPRIPAEPFRKWLAAYKNLADHSTDAMLARELGITERRLRSVLAGEYQNVSLDVVDRALLSAPLTVTLDGRAVVGIDSLYPQQIQD